MAKFEVTVVIQCDTAEQANRVLAERIGFFEEVEDENGPFNYLIDSVFDMKEID